MTADASGARSRWTRVRRELFDVREGEWSEALAISTIFFAIVAIFWVLKPIKRGMFLAVYETRGVELLGWVVQPAELEQLGKIANMMMAFVAVAVFTVLARRVRRPTLLSALCGFFSVSLVVLAAMVRSPTPVAAWALYLFGDVFSTVMVGAFWAFTSDIMGPGQAKRLYGLVGLGGVTGGFVGATLVSGSVESAGRSVLLLGCICALVVIAALTLYVDRHADRRGACPGAPLGARDGTWAALEGARLTLGSRYLLAIAGVVALYELTSNVIDFQLAAIVQTEIGAGTEKDRFFAVVGQLTGVVSIVVQLVATSLVMRRLGMSTALVVLPVSILGGALGFFVVPTLGLAAVMSTSDNALAYSINQSAKEALYVPLSRDAKYKAKAFIDMFVQRSAKVFAVGLNLAVAAAVGIEDVRWLSVAIVVIVAGWISLARWLGLRFDRRARAAHDA